MELDQALHSIQSSGEASSSSQLGPPNISQKKGCSLSLTLGFGPGLLICVVGFLAWGIPFTRLSSSISPLAGAVRAQMLKTISKKIMQTWADLHSQILEQRMRWDVEGQPMDALAEGENIGRHFFPVLVQRCNIVAIPVYTLNNGCVYLSAIQKNPLGWVMGRQNCTHRWLELWNETSQRLTGTIVSILPYLSIIEAGLGPPVSNTTPQQPFTWSALRNAQSGVGNVLSVHVGLFRPDDGIFMGRAAFTVTTMWLQHFIQDALMQQPATHGGRLALYERSGMVVAATHGKSDKNHRFPLWDIGDDDLVAVSPLVWQNVGNWCIPLSIEVHLSVHYFLETLLIHDPHPSVEPLDWCLLLLAPRDNILAPVDRSRDFAVIFVCTMTSAITILCLVLGYFVTRPIRSLAAGMQALQHYEIAAAQAMPQRRSMFSELSMAQDSYSSLVDTFHTFGKYIPQVVVRGMLEGQVPCQLGMVEKMMAVAFMDVENFTTMCEIHSSQDIVGVICKLFDLCCEKVTKADGTIDKFIGDCVMALWGAPIALENPSYNAVNALLDIMHTLQDHPLLLQGGMQVAMRMGLHGGTCLVGNFGASAHWDYTVVGDVVNISARLEPLNKQFGTHCLTSQYIYDALVKYPPLQLQMRPMGHVLLIGRQQPVAVFELLESPVDDREQWDNAIQALHAGRVSEAANYFADRYADTDDCAAYVLAQEVEEACVHEGTHVRIMKLCSCHLQRNDAACHAVLEHQRLSWFSPSKSLYIAPIPMIESLRPFVQIFHKSGQFSPKQWALIWFYPLPFILPSSGNALVMYIGCQEVPKITLDPKTHYFLPNIQLPFITTILSSYLPLLKSLSPALLKGIASLLASRCNIGDTAPHGLVHTHTDLPLFIS